MCLSEGRSRGGGATPNPRPRVVPFFPFVSEYWVSLLSKVPDTPGLPALSPSRASSHATLLFR